MATATKKTIHEALTAVMDEVGAVGKNEKNTHQHFNFRGIDAVINACSPALRKHGVLAVPEVVGNEFEIVTTNGKAQTRCRITLKVTWYGPAGDSITSTTCGEAMDYGDKATAKAHSVALRIAYLQTLALPTCEPDPDEFTYQTHGGGPSDDEVIARIKDCKTVDECRQLWTEVSGVRPLNDKLKGWFTKRNEEINGKQTA